MSKPWFRWGFALALTGVAFLADGLLRELRPGWHPSARLALLLVVTKAAADLLEAPRLGMRPTLYYADYLGQWAYFGLLAAVAVAAHLVVVATVSIDWAPATWPLALGVYLAWRLTVPRP